MNAAELGLQKAIPAAVAADEKLSLAEKVTVAHDLVIQRVRGRNSCCGSFFLNVVHLIIKSCILDLLISNVMR